jgi:DNA-directed RNA polymerase specialized sigma24 family protein
MVSLSPLHLTTIYEDPVLSERLYIEMSARLRPYALRLTNGNVHDSEDLVQETICKILKDPTRLHFVANPVSYVYVILHHVWIDKKKRDANLGSLDDESFIFLDERDSGRQQTGTLFTLEKALLIREILYLLTPNEQAFVELLLLGTPIGRSGGAWAYPKGPSESEARVCLTKLEVS